MGGQIKSNTVKEQEEYILLLQIFAGRMLLPVLIGFG
jgi:hypothetical protein